MRHLLLIVVIALSILSCAENESATCDTVTVDGTRYCVYEGAITETGYVCPQEMPNMYRDEVRDIVACTAAEERPPFEELENAEQRDGGRTRSTDPDDYDQGCEWDSDCALVHDDVCGCENTCPDAIARSAEEEFNRNKEAATCDQSGECPSVQCPEHLAVCASGTCDSIEKRFIGSDQFDRSCEVDTDCVAINTGEICSACDCDASAINRVDLENFEEIVADIDCNPGPLMCNCERPSVAYCENGRCEVTWRGTRE